MSSPLVHVTASGQGLFSIPQSDVHSVQMSLDPTKREQTEPKWKSVETPVTTIKKRQNFSTNKHELPPSKRNKCSLQMNGCNEPPPPWLMEETYASSTRFPFIDYSEPMSPSDTDGLFLVDDFSQEPPLELKWSTSLPETDMKQLSQIDEDNCSLNTCVLDPLCIPP
ncbi:hypothetical protein ABVK25_008807 [Lepraria finkii]|uniref:Securin n=1 Tax=Lepraria finkii TaxID=1340010 RepID=A0ABR4AZ19_9LECA